MAQTDKKVPPSLNNIQEQVLEILRQGASPLSAYDVLAVLSKENPKIAPPTVYRALSRLTEVGFAHRLESVNAYVSCRCESHESASVLAICSDCGTVEENVDHNITESLSTLSGKSGFAPQRHVIEVHGLCAGCNTSESPQ